MNRKVYLSSSIFTSENSIPEAGAVVVEGDRIVYAGLEEGMPSIREDDVVEDLGDRTIVPGFIDCHAHSFLGIRMLQNNACSLSPTYTEEELIEAMTTFIDNNPEPINGLYYFFDYDFEHSGRFTKYRLDEMFGDKAIMLTDFSLHGGAFSSKALELLEDDGTIPAGSNVQYEADGSVGYWGEAAFFKLHTKAMMLGGDDLNDETIDKIQELYNSNGYTSIAEMRPLGSVTDYIWAENQYLKREKEGGLSLRIGVCSSLVSDSETWLEDKEKFNGDYVFFNALKGFMDGGYINSTAWTTAEWIYGENKGTETGPTNDMELYARKIKEANDLGIGVRLHAEGDLAIEKALELFAQSENKSVLNQIEHGTAMTEKTLADIREYMAKGRRLSVNMQPAFLYNEAPTKEHPASCGNEFYDRCAVRVKSIMETGADVSVGSTDFPVTQPVPSEHIRIAVNRLSDEADSVYFGGGYTKHEAITLAEAIIGNTHKAAAALGRSDDLGLIKVGYKADLTIFDQDIFKLNPEDYKTIKVFKTISNGKEVYTHD